MTRPPLSIRKGLVPGTGPVPTRPPLPSIRKVQPFATGVWDGKRVRLFRMLTDDVVRISYLVTIGDGMYEEFADVPFDSITEVQYSDRLRKALQ